MLRAAALLLAVLFGISTYSQSAQAGSRNRSIAIGAGVLGLAIIAAGAQGERASHRKRQSSRYGNRSERKYGKQSRQSKKSRRNNDDDDAAASAKASGKSNDGDQKEHVQEEPQDPAADDTREKSVAREEPADDQRSRQNGRSDDVQVDAPDDRAAVTGRTDSNSPHDAVEPNGNAATEASQEELAQEEADQPLSAPRPSIEWQGKPPGDNRVVERSDPPAASERVESKVRPTSASTAGDLNRAPEGNAMSARADETGSVKQDVEDAPRNASKGAKLGSGSEGDRTTTSNRNTESGETRSLKPSRNNNEDRPVKAVRNETGFDSPMRNRTDGNGTSFSERNSNAIQETRNVDPSPQNSPKVNSATNNRAVGAPIGGVIQGKSDQPTTLGAKDGRSIFRSANRGVGSKQQAANTPPRELAGAPNFRSLQRPAFTPGMMRGVQTTPAPSRRPHFRRRVMTNAPQQFQQQQFQQQRFQTQQSSNNFRRQQTYRSWRQRF